MSLLLQKPSGEKRRKICEELGVIKTMTTCYAINWPVNLQSKRYSFHVLIFLSKFFSGILIFYQLKLACTKAFHKSVDEKSKGFIIIFVFRKDYVVAFKHDTFTPL